MEPLDGRNCEDVCHLFIQDLSSVTQKEESLSRHSRRRVSHLSFKPMSGDPTNESDNKLVLAPKRGPFKPTSNHVNLTSPIHTSRKVTLPNVPELYMPVDQILTSIPTSLEKKAMKMPKRKNMSTQDVLNLSKKPIDGMQKAQNRPQTKFSNSEVLDAFFSLNQRSSPQSYEALLSRSWSANPELTLRLIWNLRSIHEGKSSRESFYRAFAWLYNTYPRTAIANLKELVEPVIRRPVKRKIVQTKSSKEAEADTVLTTLTDVKGDKSSENKSEEMTVGLPHGYWKDLLNILLLAAAGELTPTASFATLHVPRIAGKPRKKASRKRIDPVTKRPLSKKELRERSCEERIHEALQQDKEFAKMASSERLEKSNEWSFALAEKLRKDKIFRALYSMVAQLFADALARDITTLREIVDEKTMPERKLELSYQISLVGKWAPTAGGAHDRRTCITTAIAELLYSGKQLPLQDLVLLHPLDSSTAHKLRGAYTRWIVSPLRRFIQVPEIRMSTKKWDKIKYARVPSKCMQMNKEVFFKHDEQRFIEYINDVFRGRKKISGATLLPHQLLAEAIKANELLKKRGQSNVQRKLAEVSASVMEAQWEALIERIREAGVLDNAIAICDVSDSMGQLKGNVDRNSPIFASVALSILLSKLASPPWSDCFITFAMKPQVIQITPGASLAEAAQEMVNSPMGFNTNYNAVFLDLILPMALKSNLKQTDMIKRLFVFTDMEFDDTRPPPPHETMMLSRDWREDHRMIENEFRNHGYQMPEIVYWNLGNSVTPSSAPLAEKAIAFMSGFSPAMLKLFMEKGPASDETPGRQLDPMTIMLKALNKESFKGLKVWL